MFRKDEKKDYNLLKVIGIAFLLFVVLSWIIKSGSFSGSEFTVGDITPVGLYGIFSAPIYSFAVFAQYFILILCIGGFYGVLNKTSVYQRIIEFFTKKSKIGFLIGSVITFALITSFFGETMMVFVLLPFFVTVLFKMGYNKVVSLASTVGASLIGMIASVTGNLAIYKNYFNLDGNTNILFNVIMLMILVFLLIMYIIPKTKDTTKSSKDIPLYLEEKDNKKSVVPLVIILCFVTILLVLGLYNWYYSFNISLFNDLYEWISGITLFNIDIFTKVFGEVLQIGYFTNYDLCAILVISSFIVAWVYNIKLSDFIDSFKNGAKEVLIPAIYVVLASTIFSQIVTSSSGNISLTISNFFLNLSNSFNIFTGIITSMFGSFFYNDYLYLMNGLYSKLSLYDINDMPLILNVFQSIHGLMMMILPVSITLVFGFKYMNVSYKEWFKFIWKFLIQLFAIIIIGNIILSMII